MALNEKLNQRIRDILKRKRGVTEQNMFGGLCFMHHGNMICGADIKNGLMVRIGPEKYQQTLKSEHVREMNLTGKPLTGLVFINPDGYKNKSSLKQWINKGLDFTTTLPKK